MEREKNVVFFTREKTTIDQLTGEILSSSKETLAKTSSEPDFIKVYYRTIMAFNQIHNIPVSFVVSLSKFINFTNEGGPMIVALNKMHKEIICKDCGVDIRQISRYIKTSVESGLLFKTNYRGCYEVNPCLIAKGKWDSIKELQANFDFVNGKWVRTMELQSPKAEEESTETKEDIVKHSEPALDLPGQTFLNNDNTDPFAIALNESVF